MRCPNKDRINLERFEIRLGRAIRALLQKGMTPEEVAELLELKITDLILWINQSDREIP